MPLIRVDVFRDELSPHQSADLIRKITDVVAEVTSEKLRDATWVLIHEVGDGHWGVGGKPLGLRDVERLTADEE